MKSKHRMKIWRTYKIKNVFVFTFFLMFMSFTAKKQSNSELKPNVSDDSTAYILYLFTGSDWCANCKRLEKKVLSDSEFISSLAKHNIELEVIDFPQRKKLSPETILYNDSMAQDLKFDGGFPGIVLRSNTSLSTQKLKYSNETSQEFLTLLLDSKAKLK